MDNVFVVIPTLNPEEELFIPLIKELKKEFKNIIVVNDGSTSSYDEIFTKINKQCTILKHYINLGKGAALKTATNYILNNYDKVDAIVTADSDGQHQVSDIKKCAQAAIKHKNAYILGTRDFKNSNVPFKSRYGNIITRNIMKMFIGLSITDTQTGLRAMGKDVAIHFLKVKGDRYEYETNTLIECKSSDIKIVEVPISTIYINDNKASHFNPIKDSISIYKLFLKYIFGSLSSFALDLILFAIFSKILSFSINYAFIATIFARVLSSLYNFLVNSKLVFKKMNKYSFIKYVILVLFQMLVSALAVNYLNHILDINVLIIKIVIDSIIFIINFIIQREWIFKNS